MSTVPDPFASVPAPRVEYFGTKRFRRRYGRCHELAAVALVFKGAVPEGTVLVCGEADGRCHSWLVLPDGACWDPVTCEVASGPDGGDSYVGKIYYRLTASEVARAIFTTSHYGSWSEAEVEEAQS